MTYLIKIVRRDDGSDNQSISEAADRFDGSWDKFNQIATQATYINLDDVGERGGSTPQAELRVRSRGTIAPRRSKRSSNIPISFAVSVNG